MKNQGCWNSHYRAKKATNSLSYFFRLLQLLPLQKTSYLLKLLLLATFTWHMTIYFQQR
jgi:hypothetical protein